MLAEMRVDVHSRGRPPALGPGDRVAVVAPASPFDRERFERGMAALRALGLAPSYGSGIFEKERAYLAGNDARRAAELREAVLDDDVRAIILARGGYGILRFAGALSPQEIAQRPKLIIGYSDATVLHELWARAGVPSIHGPMCTQLGEDGPALERLRALLFGERPAPIRWELLRPDGARGGRAEGPLRGGNLAVLASLCGTPLQPRFAGCLVLIEDTSEPPYRLDRYITQLLLSGAFEGALGFVVGDLFGQGEQSEGRAEAVAERLGGFGVPVAFGAPFGHAGRNHPVALGIPHALDADAGALVPLESATV